jgi:hypothetical protein
VDLATHQRQLLGLFRSRHKVSERDDSYIRRVAESKDLAEARGNIFLWRIYVLEKTAPLTFALLKRRNLLARAVNSFIETCNISPFRETQAPAFLELLGQHEETLVASVAQFELALLKVRQGDPAKYVIPWSVEPHTIIDSLARHMPLDGNPQQGNYHIVVSRDLPFRFEIFITESINETAAAS